MRVVVVTPPAPVIDLAEAKAHLRVDHGDDDALIAGYVAAATGHIDGPDGWLGRSIGAQTLELHADVFRDAMRLPYGPIIEIVSVSHLDASGSLVTLLPSSYEVRGHLIGAAFGKRWPSVGAHPEAVRIRYLAGYPVDDSGDEPRSTLPPAIRAAILLMVGDLYRYRGTAVDTGAAIQVSTPVQTLLHPFRVYA